MQRVLGRSSAPSLRRPRPIPPGTSRRGWPGSPAASSRWAPTTREAAPAEQPAHRVRVDGFWMDETEVTNAQFRRFVEATGYVDHGRAAGRLGAAQESSCRPARRSRPDDQLVPGSLVFTPPDRPGLARRQSRVVAVGRRARAGGTPRGRAARSTARTTTRSSTSPGTTPSPTRSGPASGCRPRPSGSSPPAAGWTASKYAWGDELPARRQAAGEHLAGPLPRHEHRGPTASPGRPR